MTQHPDARIFLVDDDAGVRDALAWLLRTRRLLSEGFDSADAFLAEIARWHSEPSSPCCLLLDVRMPGTSGLALFEHLLTLSWQAVMPVIFLSGHADVPPLSTPSSAGLSTSAKNRSPTTPWSIASSRRSTSPPRCWPRAARSVKCSSG
jgi:FixJ family two-component response regulator